ncbi:MAG: hypothetical protein ACRDP1_12235 [Nocardioidaceae bacterium]
MAMLLGVLLGRSIRSPAQQALDTQPPGKSVITAPVTSRASTGQVVTRGTIAVGQTVSVGPVQASTPVSVVTGVFVASGQTVRAGRRLIEVSGRPVFLLQGAFAAYRDIRIGERGPDAAEVNRALSRIGLPALKGSTFTAGTSSALAELYRRFGYASPSGGGLDRREVVFAPDSSAVVTSVVARVGGSATTANLVVMSSGKTLVSANMDPNSARAVHVGDAAEIFLDGSGGQVSARVASVTVGSTVQTTSLTLKPLAPIDPTNSGADVRVVVTERSTGKSTLSVPVSAVYSQSNGQTAVVVQAGSSQQVVPVQVGPVVGGFIGVAPMSGGPGLRVGDQVVVSGPGLN